MIRLPVGTPPRLVMALAIGVLVLTVAGAGMAARHVANANSDAPPLSALRVCSDPNNLPFSNAAEEGFENRIAEIVAAELGRRSSSAFAPGSSRSR